MLDAPRFEIEVKTAGVWETHDYADDLETALQLASSLVGGIPEDRIRIVTPDIKIL